MVGSKELDDEQADTHSKADDFVNSPPRCFWELHEREYVFKLLGRRRARGCAEPKLRLGMLVLAPLLCLYWTILATQINWAPCIYLLYRLWSRLAPPLAVPHDNSHPPSKPKQDSPCKHRAHNRKVNPLKHRKWQAEQHEPEHGPKEETAPEQTRGPAPQPVAP